MWLLEPIKADLKVKTKKLRPVKTCAEKYTFDSFLHTYIKIVRNISGLFFSTLESKRDKKSKIKVVTVYIYFTHESGDLQNIN